MYLLDIIILTPLLLFAIRGFMSGFIKQFFGIVGIILAVYVTFSYMGAVSHLFTPWIEQRDTAVLTAAILLFIFTLILINLLSGWMDSLLSFIRLNFINRFAGFLFGLMYASVIISVLLLILAGFDIPSEEMRSQSYSYPLVIQTAPIVYDTVASFWPEARTFIETIEQSIMDNNTLRNLPLFDNRDS